MIATLLSPAEGLLVAREEHASLPSLNKNGRLTPENMMLVAQMSGERHEGFVERVLNRAGRAVHQGRPLRAAVFSVEATATPAKLASRQRLLLQLAEMLADGPDVELIIQAPSNVAANDRVALFELVESTMRAAPKLHVRLTFAEPAESRAEGRAHRHHRVSQNRPIAEA